MLLSVEIQIDVIFWKKVEWAVDRTECDILEEGK